MNIELYHEFIVLAEELNFHQASKRLHTTQSTLSKHVASLERHYGVRLFERDRMHVRLTTHGTILLECAVAIWNDYEQSIALVKNSTRSARKLFVGGVLGDSSMFPETSAALDRLLQARHRSSIHFVPSASTSPENQAQLVKSGEVDCSAFFFSDKVFDEISSNDEFGWAPVCHVPMDAIVRSTHPLASKEKLNVRDLFDCTLIRLVGAHLTPIWRLLERQLAQADVMYRTRLFTASSSLDYSRLDPGDAVLLDKRPSKFSPKSVGETERQEAEIAHVPVADDELYLDLRVLYLKERLTPELVAFIKALCSVYEKAYPKATDHNSSASVI